MMVPVRYAYVSIWVWYGFRWHSNESQVSLIWLVRVLSKPISHSNGCHMHFLARNTLQLKFDEKAKIIWKITNTCSEPQSAVWLQIKTVLNIETGPWSARISPWELLFCLFWCENLVFDLRCEVIPVINRWCLKRPVRTLGEHKVWDIVRNTPFLHPFVPAWMIIKLMLHSIREDYSDSNQTYITCNSRKIVVT